MFGKVSIVLLAIIATGKLAHCQTTGQNVVNVVVQNPIAVTGSTSFVSSALQNIGQSSHQAQIIVTGQTHVVGVTGVIEGSSNGVQWFTIGPRFSSVSLNAVSALTGYRTYPLVRTNITVLPTGGDTVLVSIYYQGNSVPSFVLTDALGLALDQRTFSVALTDGSTLQVVSEPTVFGQRPTLYGWSVYLPSTATGFEMGCSSDGITFDGLVVDFVTTVPTGGVAAVHSIGSRPYAQCQANELLYATVSGSGGASISTYYRNE